MLKSVQLYLDNNHTVNELCKTIVIFVLEHCLLSHENNLNTISTKYIQCEFIIFLKI